VEALDRRVRSEEDVEKELGLPLLARIPTPPRRHRGGIAMIEARSGVYAEAIRRLATNIVFSDPDHPARVLMFTSALQEEGKSTTLANLAVALAAVGNRVVLVDLDLRRPSLASLFGVRRLTGLTDVAVGRKPLDSALCRVELPEVEQNGVTRSPDLDYTRSPGLGQSGETPDTYQPSLPGALYVLPTGPLPLSPGEFVASDALATRVLAPLRHQADYVLVDSPPVCVVGDAIRLSAQMDAVVAVTRVGLANRSALHDLRRQLADAPVPTLGVVVANINPPAAYGYSRYVQSSVYGPRSWNGTSDASRPSPRARV
jgi:Mrp family chromosome partitioning ATPase